MACKSSTLSQITPYNKEALNELSEIVNRMSLSENLTSSKLVEASQKLDGLIMEYYYCFGKNK
jgi:hypothetical protein